MTASTSSPDPADWVLLHGAAAAPPERILLRAGPVTMVFEPSLAFLRHVAVGGREILRGIYAAVRDEHWNTVAPLVSNLKQEINPDGFEISFDAECRDGRIDFFWKGRITGDMNGTVSFSFDGEAVSAFPRNRIGFCVLHPAEECAGRPCSVEHVDGTVEKGRFPSEISPHQPFMSIRAIAYDPFPGTTFSARCEGDIFEMEDQRNWTDASFKTYCTPLVLARPVRIVAGTVISQKITLSVKGNPPATPQPGAPAEPVSVSFNAGGFGAHHSPVPILGLGASSDGAPLSKVQAERLGILRPGHLRVDLNLADTGYAARFKTAVAEAGALGIPLEVALHASAAAEKEFEKLALLAGELKPRVSAWLLVPASDKLVHLARRLLWTLTPGALLGGGSGGNFVELNRNRPLTGALDIVCYGANPQVHAVDDASLMETIRGQKATVESARKIAGGSLVAVTPVALKARGTPPDARQKSLFCAAWTVGSIAALISGGARRMTYHETAGAGGVLDEHGVFPVYHVLADIGEFTPGGPFTVETGRPDYVACLVMVKDGRIRIILANLTPEKRDISITAPGPAGSCILKRLDLSTIRGAMESPEVFRKSPGKLALVLSDRIEDELPPYGILRIDGSAPGHG